MRKIVIALVNRNNTFRKKGKEARPVYKRHDSFLPKPTRPILISL